MKLLDYLQNKERPRLINKFSIIGSIFYGLICAINAVPEMKAKIGYCAYPFNFILAVLFFFIVYAICKAYDIKFRKSFFKALLKFILLYIATTIVAAIMYMGIFHVSYIQAIEKIARYVSNFFYYIPFLP